MGIDYGRGITNVSDTYVDGVAIRYGVISQNELLQSWSDESEPDYGPPHCPACGNQLDDDVDDGHECECGYVIKWIGDECYGDDPLAYRVNDSEYTAESDSYGDIFITRSPYFTKCAYCSPCAPGAGYLTSSSDDCLLVIVGNRFSQVSHNILRKSLTMNITTELPFPLDSFVDSFFESLIWSESEIDDDATVDDIDETSRRKLECECECFLWRIYLYLLAIERGDYPNDGVSSDGSDVWQLAAHDFCLTRNGHGAGFWDGDWETYGDMFTRISQSFGETECYVGDDGKIHC